MDLLKRDLRYTTVRPDSPDREKLGRKGATKAEGVSDILAEGKKGKGTGKLFRKGKSTRGGKPTTI